MKRSLVTLSVLLAASLASADDLEPPPATCPPGAVGHSEHAGVWCVPTSCETDRDCTVDAIRRRGSPHYRESGPLVCREVGLCVVEEEYALGGNIPADPPPTRTRRVVRGECIDGACPAGGMCEEARRCAPGSGSVSGAGSGAVSGAGAGAGSGAGAVSGAGAESDSGCTISSGSPMPWSFALALTLLWGSRRR